MTVDIEQLNCCESNEDDPCSNKKPIKRMRCPVCATPGDPVAIRTLYHQVASEHILRIERRGYWFCNSPQCGVVYFGEKGEPFRIQEVREIVTAKLSGDTFPVCYCFGFNSDYIRRMSRKSDLPAVSQIIRDLISNGMCECEIRNPSGKCCLGAVVAVEKQSEATEEHS